jgi:acetyl-CoA/propionyl-CoA carboxylase biotin carboxyl carrier protein
MATALTFHRKVVDDPAFAPADPDQPFTIHTRWIETEFVNDIPKFSSPAARPDDPPRETVVVEVGGKRLEVVLPAGLGAGSGPAKPAGPPRRGGGAKTKAQTSGDALEAPMQGTIVKVLVAEGDTVAEGDLVVVLEAMKMEQPLSAHKSGVVTGLTAEVGVTVAAGAVLCDIKDS